MLTFAALIVIAAPALADMEADLGLAIDVTGDAVPGDSYAKRITITTALPFDLIAVAPVGSSLSLSDPFLNRFNPDDWTLLVTTPTLAAAQGTPLPFGTRYTQSFNIELEPSSPPTNMPHDGDAFMVAVWAELTDPVVGEWGYQYRTISYQWGTWTVGETAEWNISRDQIIHVPAPAAIGLGMLGLGLIGWYMRRFA